MIEICNAFASTPTCTPDWEGISAIFTAGATATALSLPLFLRWRDQMEKRKASSYSLFSKLLRVHGDFLQIWQHVLLHRKIAAAHNQPANSCMFFMSIANPPRDVAFSADEINQLLAWGDIDLFTLISPLSDMHSGAMTSLRTYATMRNDLVHMLPPGTLDGEVGTHYLTKEQHKAVAPFVKQLDGLVASISEIAESNFEQAHRALAVYHALLKRETDLKGELAFSSEINAAVDALSGHG